jgi:hypothetical protein
MPTDWRIAYEAAIREHDPAKIAEACEKARTAINDRMFEIVKEKDQRETEALEEALRQLVIHEHRHKS